MGGREAEEVRQRHRVCVGGCERSRLHVMEDLAEMLFDLNGSTGYGTDSLAFFEHYDTTFVF